MEIILVTNKHDVFLKKLYNLILNHSYYRVDESFSPKQNIYFRLKGLILKVPTLLSSEWWPSGSADGRWILGRI